VQDRFSVVVEGGKVVSTEATPVVHKPRDELGGGSAWAGMPSIRLLFDI